MNELRGVYNNINRAKQLLLFEGMQYQKITPTDVDGIIEYHDKAWFIYEVKLHGTELKYGQRLMLERFCNDMSATGKYVIAIIADHEEFDPDEPVWLKDCVVREIKIKTNKWRKTIMPMTVGELTDICIELIDAGNTKRIEK